MESKLLTLKQQNDAMLAKMDNVAGMSKLDHWSMWSESDRREVLLKKAFPDKELMALCTIARISKVWVQLGSCSLKKFVDFQIRESFSKDKDALTKLCFLTGREVPEFVISGLTYRTTNPALHSSLAEHLPEMMDATSLTMRVTCWTQFATFLDPVALEALQRCADVLAIPLRGKSSLGGGRRYSGPIDADPIGRAICAAYVAGAEPPECSRRSSARGACSLFRVV